MGIGKNKNDAAHEDDSSPLTAAEIIAIRAELAQTARVRWLWASIRAWAAWITGSLVLLVWFKDKVSAVWKVLIG